MRSIWYAAAVAGLSLVSLPGMAQSQIMYLRGQAVQPTFEGSEDHPDGSHTLWFGYMNRNHEEQPYIPIGPDNFFSVAESGVGLAQIRQALESEGPQASALGDRGQPTHFYPRRQTFVFGVDVPADFGDRELVWAVRRNGELATAIGKLEPVWVWNLNPGIYRGIHDPESPNQAPTMEVIGATRVTVGVGEPIVLTISVEDDGLPEIPEARIQRPSSTPMGTEELPLDVPWIHGSSGEPGRQAVVSFSAPRETGMALTWVLYRGPGGADFSPEVSLLDNAGGTATTTVRFRAAGTHEVRAFADDGLYFGSAVVNVIVEERP